MKYCKRRPTKRLGFDCEVWPEDGWVHEFYDYITENFATLLSFAVIDQCISTKTKDAFSLRLSTRVDARSEKAP